MKRLLALFLAVMMLACVPALAEEPAAAAQAEEPAASAARTVYAQLSIDRDAARSVMAQSGMPEERISAMDPVLAVLSALGIRVTGADRGVQMDLDLKGTDILSLGGTVAEDGLLIGSTLFPDYLITVSAEALTGMMRQYLPMMPAVGNGEGGADMTALAAQFSVYVRKYTEACAAAVTAGTPEKVDFDVEGCAFDTLTPMNVDTAAIAEATKALLSDLLQDGTVSGMLQSVPGFRAEERLKAAEEALSEENIPDVTADVYTSSEAAGSFYAVFEAAAKGAEDPACRAAVLSPGDGTGTVGIQVFESGVNISAAYSPDGVFMAYISEQAYYALSFGLEDADTLRMEAYITDTEKPLAVLTVTSSGEGKRTLSLDPEGKTMVKPEDLTGGQSSEVSAGLTQEIMTNLSALMMKAAGAVPEFGSLMTTLSAPQESGEKTETQEQAPEPAEADPSSWKTLGDVLALETGDWETAYGDGSFAMVFTYAGKYWYVKAEVPQEALDAYGAVDYMAEDRTAQQTAAIGSYEISSVTDLSTLAIPQEELDRWVGRTGQDMLDAGWENNGYTEREDGLFVIMVNGDFQYLVSFEGLELTEDSELPDFADAVINSVQFGGKSWNFSM